MNDTIKYIYLNFLIDKSTEAGQNIYKEALLRTIPDLPEWAWLEAEALWRRYKIIDADIPIAIKEGSHE